MGKNQKGDAISIDCLYFFFSSTVVLLFIFSPSKDWW